MTAGLTLARPPPSRCRDLVDESLGPPYSLRQAEVSFHDTEEVGMRYEVNLSILFTELPLLDRPAAARQAGFDAVEFWWPWPVAVPSL